MNTQTLDMRMKCINCKKKFNRFSANCGTGYSWDLWRCPYCKQLQAKKIPGGFIPKEVYNDSDVKIL